MKNIGHDEKRDGFPIFVILGSASDSWLWSQDNKLNNWTSRKQRFMVYARALDSVFLSSPHSSGGSISWNEKRLSEIECPIE